MKNLTLRFPCKIPPEEGTVAECLSSPEQVVFALNVKCHVVSRPPSRKVDNLFFFQTDSAICPRKQILSCVHLHGSGGFGPREHLRPCLTSLFSQYTRSQLIPNLVPLAQFPTHLTDRDGYSNCDDANGRQHHRRV